jgi:uncharacterized protein GlcG (DUF336 family)
LTHDAVCLKVAACSDLASVRTTGGRAMAAIVEYGNPISLATAKRVVEAAEAEAARNGWAMAIAIVDSGSNLVLLHRMDQAQYGSINIAQAKARSALNFKRPTKTFEDAVAQGGIGLRLLHSEGICPLEGGVPIVVENRLIGAIGVSGAMSHEDGQVAAAALRVLDR